MKLRLTMLTLIYSISVYFENFCIYDRDSRISTQVNLILEGQQQVKDD